VRNIFNRTQLVTESVLGARNIVEYSTKPFSEERHTIPKYIIYKQIHKEDNFNNKSAMKITQQDNIKEGNWRVGLQ